MDTWASLCDHIVFVVDNSTSSPPERTGKHINYTKNDSVKKKISREWEEAPESHLGFDFLRLHLEEPQSEQWRNIWEKSWKTWHRVGTQHINDSEWFLKIDDDTFFSPINFKGFARYFNPDKDWYFGNTLMHQWKSRNVVFNAGSLYALSRGALRKLVTIFESESFEKHGRSTGSVYCRKRRGDKEDMTMGVCLHSVGIDPVNTLDARYRERFSLYREKYHRIGLRSKQLNEWYWLWRPEQLGMRNECCSDHMITFHGYKHDRVDDFKALHQKYNVEEGVNGKKFEIPEYPRPFLHSEIDFVVDEWRNRIDGMAFFQNRDKQLVFQGPGRERTALEFIPIKTTADSEGN